jgi:hypothetical protein
MFRAADALDAFHAQAVEAQESPAHPYIN